MIAATVVGSLKQVYGGGTRLHSLEASSACAAEEEATGGFEPPIAVLQTAALPLGYVATGDSELYLAVGERGGLARTLV
jgi:hypothetical protein